MTSFSWFLKSVYFHKQMYRRKIAAWVSEKGQVLWFWYGFLILMGLFRTIDRVAQVLSWRFRWMLVAMSVVVAVVVTGWHKFWDSGFKHFPALALDCLFIWQTLNLSDRALTHTAWIWLESAQAQISVLFYSVFRYFDQTRKTCAGINWSSGRFGDILSRQKTTNRYYSILYFICISDVKRRTGTLSNLQQNLIIMLFC